jgi:hypothetical protein
VDLLEEAGIQRPVPHFVTDYDREVLAQMALAQRQFYYASTFFAGMIAGAVIAYYIGYDDIVRTILRWALSGTGIAFIISGLNVTRLASFRCPRCGRLFFSGVDSPVNVFSTQCGNCGLPLRLPPPPVFDDDDPASPNQISKNP